MSIDKFVKTNPQLFFSPKGYFRGEGESGVRNLARLCRGLGYADPLHYGMFEGACYGDLIMFLEDNPGAVEAICDWIEDNYESELNGESEDSDSDD